MKPDLHIRYAGLVWSGAGILNGSEIAVSGVGYREFLVTPGHDATFTNSGETVLLVYTAWPIESYE